MCGLYYLFKKYRSNNNMIKSDFIKTNRKDYVNLRF